MKNLILLAVIVLWSGNIMAQDISASEVPTIVKDAFKKEFPNSRDIEWEREGEYFNVEFEIGKNDHELWITPSGKIVKHKEDISSAELPTSIKNKIKADYKGYRIDDVDKLTLENRVFYKVEIEIGRNNNKRELDLYFDKDAKSLEKNIWYQTSF